MSITQMGLLLLLLGYGLFLLYDGLVQHYRFGKTLLAVRLRRRLADNIFLLIIVAAGIYYEIETAHHRLTLILLCALSLLVLYHGFRYPKWRLKAQGFTLGGRYWTYPAISTMQLSEDGVVLITLKNKQVLTAPVVHISDLEKALAFFMGVDNIEQLLPSQGENT